MGGENVFENQCSRLFFLKSKSCRFPLNYRLVEASARVV